MKAYNKLKKLAKDRIDEYIRHEKTNDIYSISTFFLVIFIIFIIYFYYIHYLF